MLMYYSHGPNISVSAGCAVQAEARRTGLPLSGDGDRRSFLLPSPTGTDMTQLHRQPAKIKWSQTEVQKYCTTLV